MDKFTNVANTIWDQDLIDLCQKLVRFKTVNPPGNELAAALFVEEYLQNCGLETELIMHSRKRASLIGRLKGTGEVPSLFYNGHLDVVPVGEQAWTADPFAADLIDGKIYGRGTSDMKGGNAAILAAVRALASADVNLRGDLVVAFTAGEEGEQLGALEIAKRKDLTPLQGIIIPEPSNNEVYIATKGGLWLELTTYGKTAHGSMPAQGRNAVSMMVKLLEAYQCLEIAHNPHPLLGDFTRSIGTIEGGVKTNVVPDHCTVTIDQRTIPGQDHQAIYQQVEDLIESLTEEAEGFQASVRVINDHQPVETSPDLEIVKEFSNIVEHVVGKSTVPKGVNYFTDGSVFSPQLGAPLIICGPGIAELAHQPNEYVEVSSMVKSAHILTLFAANALSGRS